MFSTKNFWVEQLVTQTLPSRYRPCVLLQNVQLNVNIEHVRQLVLQKSQVLLTLLGTMKLAGQVATQADVIANK